MGWIAVLRSAVTPDGRSSRAAGGAGLRISLGAAYGDRVLVQCAGIVVLPRRPGRPRKSPPIWGRDQGGGNQAQELELRRARARVAR